MLVVLMVDDRVGDRLPKAWQAASCGHEQHHSLQRSCAHRVPCLQGSEGEV